MAEMWRALDELERIALMKARAGLAIRPGTRFQFRTAGNEELCMMISTRDLQVTGLIGWPCSELIANEFFRETVKVRIDSGVTRAES
jgi:hypothetical protein